MLRLFLQWWIGQLLDFAPRSWRKFGPETPDALIVDPITVGDDPPGAVEISLRRNGRETAVGHFVAGDGRRPEALPASIKSTVLRLPAEDVLAKTVRLPLATEHDLAQVLGLEMDRQTPFRADELYWTHRVVARNRASGQVTVRLLLVPRLKLDPLLQFLAGIGVAPLRAEVAGGPDAGSFLPLGDDPVPTGRLRSRLIWAAAVCCVLLAVAAVVMPFVRQASMLADLDRSIASGKTAAAEVEKLRKQIDQLSESGGVLESERAKAGRPLRVLAALTQTLPDDTFLIEMSLRQGKLSLTGHASAAAPLIEALASNGEFRDPAFSAPVTRVETPHSEIFTITAGANP